MLNNVGGLKGVYQYKQPHTHNENQSKVAQ